MLRLRNSFINGVQDFLFVHGFRQLPLYSTSISTEVNPNPNLVNYLVENLGFSKKQALLTSSKFTVARQSRGIKEISDSDLFSNVSSVIEFLEKIGLQQSQIRTAFTINPRMLMCNVDKTLIPKTEILKKLGFSDTDIAEIVSVNPSLYFAGLDTTIVPAIQALRENIGCKVNDVVSLLKKFRCYNLVAIRGCLVPNVAFLQSYGVPLDLIRNFLLKKPHFLLRNTDSFRKKMIIVEGRFGIPPNSPRFLAAVHIVGGFKEKTIESKIQVFKSFGWTDSDIFTLVSTNPFILGNSEEAIKKKLDFLMNEVGYEPSYMVSKCLLFTCSLEKRIVPRYKVLALLKENGLIIKNFSLSTALVCTESKFLKKYVIPFKEVHEFYSKYAGISLEMITLESPETNSGVV